MKQTILSVVLVLISSIALAQEANLNVKVLDYGSQNRAKIIELEAAKQKIGDTISVYKKGMSKEQKDELQKDLKALRKCEFTFVECTRDDGKKVTK